MTAFLRRALRGLALAAACLALWPAAQAGDNYTQTRNPIVLVHGLFGFDTILGVDYFYGIPQALRQGGAQVYVAQVSADNSTEVRGEQLLAQVKTILALTGAQKVNLIGHSHGGPTVRYVAGVAPQLVASITSVAGPNRGTRLVDVILGLAPHGSVPEKVVTGAMSALTGLINLGTGNKNLPQNHVAALESLSTAGSLRFNQRFSAGVPTSGCGDGAELVDGVRYYSWTGNKPSTNLLDPSDAMLTATSLLFNEPNDGQVPVCSSRLGKTIGTYAHNHFDEVNQVLGLRGLFSPDPVALYREHAHRLQAQGL